MNDRDDKLADQMITASFIAFIIIVVTIVIVGSLIRAAVTS